MSFVSFCFLSSNSVPPLERPRPKGPVLSRQKNRSPPSALSLRKHASVRPHPRRAPSIQGCSAGYPNPPEAPPPPLTPPPRAPAPQTVEGEGEERAEERGGEGGERRKRCWRGKEKETLKWFSVDGRGGAARAWFFLPEGDRDGGGGRCDEIDF